MQEHPTTGIAQAEPSALGGLTPANRRLVLELAQRLLALQDLQGTRPLPMPPADLRPFLNDFEAWLTLRGRSSATRRNQVLYARHLLAHDPNPTAAHLDAFLTAKLAAGLAPASIRAIIFALRSFFGFLHYRGLIADNPTSHLVLPPLPQRERVPPSLTDVSRLFTTPITTPRDRAMLHLFIDCGLRLGELRTLRLSDVDFANAQVTVIGKGNKQRTIPFTTATALALHLYIAVLPLDTAWLFPGRSPSQPLWPRPIEERLNVLCDAAEIPRFSPHYLRHFFATHMLNSGANIKVVSNLLGHAHASTTTDIYWHVVDADQRRQEHQRHSPLPALLKETP